MLLMHSIRQLLEIFMIFTYKQNEICRSIAFMAINTGYKIRKWIGIYINMLSCCMSYRNENTETMKSLWE